MRSIFTGLSVAAITLTLGAPAFAKVETVKGMLVDQSCYKADKTNTGEKHNMKNGVVNNCATECAKMGSPVALLTADGKVYTVTGTYAANNNQKLVPHMAHAVELTGDVTTDKDGTMKITATNLKMISK